MKNCMRRQSLLATIAFFSLFSNTEAQPLQVKVDLTQVQSGMLVKSKLGFARAASFKELPNSIEGLQDLRPRIFCSELDFDDVEEPNYAIIPEPFGNGSTPIKANEWIQSLDSRLRSIGVEPHFQIIGAPLPYQQKVIKRPAIHPTPTDISLAANLTGRWIESNFAGQRGKNWLLWNEPSHTLRGLPTSVAAKDMADIFNSYAEEVRKRDEYAQIGFAAFIAYSLKRVPEAKGVSFLERVFDYTNQKHPIATSLDFVSINNYFGKTEELLFATDKALAKFNSTAPIIFSQFAPEEVADKSKKKNDIWSATNYLKKYDEFVKNPTIKNICFSYWTGASNQSFYRFNPKNGQFTKQLNLSAIKLYQQLGSWRAKLETNDPSTFAIASYQDGKVTVLISNTSKEQRIATLEIKGNTTKSWGKSELIAASEQGEKSEIINKPDPNGKASFTLPPESVSLLNFETEPKTNVTDTTDVRAVYINNNTYIHRAASRGGASFFDPQLMQYSAEVRSTEDVAHSAIRLHALPDNTKITVSAPNEMQLDTALNCLSLLAVPTDTANDPKIYKNKNNPTNASVLQRLAQTTNRTTSASALDFKKTGSNATALIAGHPTISESKLHVLLTQCTQPTQATIQLHR